MVARVKAIDNLEPPLNPTYWWIPYHASGEQPIESFIIDEVDKEREIARPTPSPRKADRTTNIAGYRRLIFKGAVLPDRIEGWITRKTPLGYEFG